MGMVRVGGRPGDGQGAKGMKEKGVGSREGDVSGWCKG